MPSLAVVSATYDDWPGIWATCQALRLDPDAKGVQFVVVDNFGCKATERFCKDWGAAKYVLANQKQGTAWPRDVAVRSADTDFVLCVDCHVLLAPGAVGRLRQFLDAYPDCDDLIQGPMLYDDLKSFATHFKPVWGSAMWGRWAADARGADPDGPAFEIPMQGLGLFCTRKEAWPGFNPAFRGFGGEEGYLHLKYKKRGDRTLCLPFLRWAHRTHPQDRPTKYNNHLTDRAFNYYLGFAELGLDPAEVTEHFASPEVGLDRQSLARLRAAAERAVEAQRREAVS